MMEDLQAKRIVARFERLKSDRGTWEAHWQDVADFVLPDRQFTADHTPGRKDRQRIYDSTAPYANMKLSSALSGLLTNPSLHWFSLGTYGDIDEKDRVRAWLDIVRDLMLEVLNDPARRFYLSINEVYQDIAGFGTGVLFFKKNADGSTTYRSVPLGDAYMDEDADGVPNTLYMVIRLDAVQAVGMFGKDALPKEIVDAAQKMDTSRRWQFVQAIFPRENRDAGRMDPSNKPWASVVVLLEKKVTVSEGGFSRFPFAVARWSKASGEKYGRGPALNVLPDVMMVNAMSKTIIEAAQKVADPPIQMPDDGFMAPLATHPGGINYYRAGTQERIEPLQTGARPDLGVDMIEQRRMIIREAHFLDMLDLPMLDRMTATEVLQRRNDKMQLLSPMIGRLITELLDPILGNTFGHLKDAGKLPEAPPELAGQNLRINYVSPLALSQRSSDSVNIQRYLEYLTPVAQIDPSVLDTIDPDRYARHGKVLFSVPQRLFRPQREVEQRRREREEAMGAQQQAETAKTAAEAAAAGASAISEVSQ